MAGSATPTRGLGKLDSLPKDELIKYIKKQASQMKDLKKKNEDLNLMLKHERSEMEKLEQEQKSWLSRGVSAEFEKKEELQKKERELQMAAHLGQQMLAENDELRKRCDELEQENTSLKEDMGAEIERLDAEKETIEQTLVMIQNEYKEAKLEAQKLTEALETATADHDKDYEKWEEERKELREKINDLTLNGTSNNSTKVANLNSLTNLNDINNALQEEIEELKEQIKLMENDGQQCSDDMMKENNEIKAKLEANNVELKAQDESLKVLRTKCEELNSKTEELHQLIDMVSAERDESNAYSQQLGDELKVMKEEREKMIRSLKTLKGKLEKATNVEETLKSDLSALTTDKGELQMMVKNLQREKKNLMQSNKKLKDKLKITSTRQGSFDEGNGESPLEKENDELRKEIKLLKLKCENEDGELDSLKNNNKELSKERESLKEEVSSLMDKLLGREQELNDKVVEIEGEKAMVVKLQTRVDELLSTLQSLNEEKMHQESEIEELFKTHDELQIRYDKECKDKMEKENAIQKLQDELMKEKDHSMNLQEQLFSLQNSSQSRLLAENNKDTTDSGNMPNENETTLQKEVESKCNEIEQLKKQLVETEEELEMERKQRKVLETNFNEKVSSVDEFEADEMRIASMNEESIEEIERLKKEVDQLRREKESLEQSMVEMEEKMLQEKVEEVKRSVEEAKQKEIEAMEESKEELERNLNEIVQELEGQKEIVVSLSARIENLQKDLQNGEQEKDELMKSIDVMKKSCEEKDKEYDVVMQEMSIVKAKEISLNEELAEMKKTVACNEQDGSNEIGKYKKAYKKLKEKFNEVGSINEELNSELQTKTAVIEELRKELHEKNDVIEKDMKIDDREELNTAIKNVEEKEKVIAQLEMELKRFKDSDNSKDLIEEIVSLKSEIEKMEDVQGKLEKCENERVYLDAEVKKRSDECEEIRMELMREGEINREKQLIIDNVNAENSNLKNLARELEVRVKELVSEKEKIYIDLKDLNTVNGNLKEKEQELVKLKVLFENLEAEKEEMCVSYKQLDDNKGETDKTISILRSEIETAKNSEAEKALYISQIELDFSNIKKKLSEYEVEVEKMGKMLGEREIEAKEKDAVVLNLENSCKQLEESLRNVNDEFDVQRRRLADVLEENKSLLLVKEELSANLNEKIGKLSSLENRKVEFEQQQKASANEHREILENEIKVLNEKLANYEEMKNEVEKMQRMCEEKEVKIKKCNDVISEHENKLEATSSELSLAKAKYENVINSTGIKENELSTVAEDLKVALARIESLEEENKEKNEKVNKFKSVAIKAKKEIDSIKVKTSNEKKELEESIQSLNTELRNVKELFSQQSQELANVKEAYEKLANDFDAASCNLEKETQRSIEAKSETQKLTGTIDHLQVSLASVENQNASLQLQLKEREESVAELTRQFNQSANSVTQLEQQLAEEKSGHDATKDELSKVSGDLENAKKDVNQMKMISLEMDDYHRTVQSLQNKLSESEIECKEAHKRIHELEQEIETLKEQIASADEKSNSASKEIEKLTTFLTEKESEIDTLIAEKKDLEEKEVNFKQNVEELSAKCEEKMVQISEFASEREKILLQLKNEKDLHSKNIHSAESKLSRTKTELSLLQEAYENCKQEFESYRIRAQNVLKQQKMKQTEKEDSQILQEKSRLEKIVEELREKLKDTNGQLSANLAENEDLEAEYEKLQNRYGELVKDISEKETQWRERFTGIQSEMKKQSTESEQKILLLSQEKDSLQEQIKSNEEYETMAQDYEETIKELKEEIFRLRSSPKRQTSREKKPTIDTATKEHRATPEHLKLTTQNLSDLSHGLVERPGAEGMDSSELEAIDKSSLPATPLSADSASILDKILSPTEQQSSWPTSPTSSKEEGFRLRSALATTEKNVEHLTELLAETEGSNVRLTEQIKLLKSEIRRMQQNQEREEALHNLEYLKNVIIKFMKCNTTERECLVPVISTMLKLTTEEKQFISEFAKGEADQDANAGGWSSYVYKWTSFS